MLVVSLYTLNYYQPDASGIVSGAETVLREVLSMFTTAVAIGIFVAGVREFPDTVARSVVGLAVSVLELSPTDWHSTSDSPTTPSPAFCWSPLLPGQSRCFALL